MSIFSKRIQAAEINLDEYGRDRGDLTRLLELDRDWLIVREVKTFRTDIVAKYDPRFTRIDIYKSTDLQSGNAVGSAVVGGLLFGGIGAVVGAIAGSSKKPFWIVEITDATGTRLFKLKGDTDKIILDKYITKSRR